MTESSLPDSLPSAAELRSENMKVFNEAWEIAYPVFYGIGMCIARRHVKGAHLETQREDLVATAISQLQQAILAGAE